VYAYVRNSPLGFLDALGLDTLTAQQIANILFNETSILSGPGLFDAQVAIARALQNGLNDPSGPPSHAPDMPPDRLTPSAQSMMNQCRQAAARATTDSTDPTHGADHYMMVDPTSTFPASVSPIPFHGDRRYGVVAFYGPFTAGPGRQVSGPNVFILIYSGP
jgi:hypothetical protein